jgi:hypothetical protein
MHHQGDYSFAYRYDHILNRIVKNKGFGNNKAKSEGKRRAMIPYSSTHVVMFYV